MQNILGSLSNVAAALKQTDVSMAAENSKEEEKTPVDENDKFVLRIT